MAGGRVKMKVSGHDLPLALSSDHGGESDIGAMVSYIFTYRDSRTNVYYKM